MLTSLLSLLRKRMPYETVSTVYLWIHLQHRQKVRKRRAVKRAQYLLEERKVDQRSSFGGESVLSDNQTFYMLC